MGVIPALELHNRNRERVNVYLDGVYSFSLTLIEAARLHKGQTLTDADIAALRGEDDVHKAVDSALRLLAHRPRSLAEIRRNLSEKDIDEAVIAAALERLTNLGYVDDAAFARFWVENRTLFKPLGPAALRYELRQKGVADPIISEVLSDLDVTESAYRAAAAQARRYRGTDPRTFRQKTGSFLQRRGFSYAIITEVTNRLIDELSADDGDFFAAADDLD